MATTNAAAPWAPQQSDPGPTDEPQAALTAPAVEVDPNDPRLTSESMETDATVDAYAVPPPLPDGKWRVKLRLADIKNPQGQVQPEHFLLTVATWRNPPAPFFCVNVESEVIDLTGRYDGVKLTDYWVKTLVDERKAGASALATVVRKSGGVVPLGSNQLQVKDIALKHLAGDPECLVETQWVVRCQACEQKADKSGEKKPKPYLRGMHRFPPKSHPHVKFDAEVKCTACGGLNRAMPQIVQYFTLSEAKPTYDK